MFERNSCGRIICPLTQKHDPVKANCIGCNPRCDYREMVLNAQRLESDFGCSLFLRDNNGKVDTTMIREKNNHWFEVNGIRVFVHHYSSDGYVIARSDIPGLVYFGEDGKPFPTREAAKNTLDVFYQNTMEFIMAFEI